MIGGGIMLSWPQYNKLKKEIEDLKAEIERLNKKIEDLEEARTSRFKIPDAWFEDEEDE